MSLTDDISLQASTVIKYLHKEELGMEEGKRMSTCATDYGKCEYG